MTEADARRRVEQARVARLATHDLGGRIHVVPICFALDGDVLYSAVDAKPKRTRELRRLANVRAHADVAVIVDEYTEDWSALWWVRLRGKGRILDSGDERDRAAALLRREYLQYAEQPLDDPVLAIDVDEWRGWSATPG
jgi:PPOX class probable F420-dependent enzyme